MRSCEDVKAEFDRHGVSIADWARRNGYPPPLVYRVLSGAKPKRGKSHEIAVLLGIKAGDIGGYERLSFATAAQGTRVPG